MRDITWQMFELTGDIDAYLLYRACDEPKDEMEADLPLVAVSLEGDMTPPHS